MVRAADLQSIGNALGVLVDAEVRDRSELGKWEAEARVLWERIAAAPELSNAMPHFVWHYLSDADIRLKDPRYAQLQREQINDIVRVLKRGQVPA